jgi:hypothetical protein
MNMRTIHVCALVALAASSASLVFLGGCSNNQGAATDCLSLCDDSNNCPGAPMTDCMASCSAADTLNMDSGCTVQYNDVLMCAGAQSDVCNTPATACSHEIAAYQACIEAFCMQSPRPAACNATP